MAWSTREIADLAGTTVNTVRHYHALGLLEEPARRANGYKQYGVAHLVRLLRVRRLAELGVPLSQIDGVDADGGGAKDTLRALDAELAARIASLQRAREEIAAILHGDAPADAPAGFASVAAQLTDADSSMIHIYTRVYDEGALADVRRMVEAGAGTVATEVDELPADAEEATRQRLAEGLAPVLARNLRDYPWLADPLGHLTRSEHVTRRTIVEALVALYNPAQLDVFARASVLARALASDAEGAAGVDAAGEPRVAT